MSVDPSRPPVPRPEGPLSRNVLLAAGAAGLLLLVLLCGGGTAMALLSRSGTASPADVRRGVTVRFYTTNDNPMDRGRGVVKEVHGQWVLMQDADKADRVVWVNFNNVVWYRIEK